MSDLMMSDLHEEIRHHQIENQKFLQTAGSCWLKQ